VFFNEWMIKQGMVNPYYGIEFIDKKEQIVTLSTA
jgi:endonuclease YncB( thermonuclease family)